MLVGGPWAAGRGTRPWGRRWRRRCPPWKDPRSRRGWLPLLPGRWARGSACRAWFLPRSGAPDSAGTARPPALEDSPQTRPGWGPRCATAGYTGRDSYGPGPPGGAWTAGRSALTPSIGSDGIHRRTVKPLTSQHFHCKYHRHSVYFSLTVKCPKITNVIVSVSKECYKFSQQIYCNQNHPSL